MASLARDDAVAMLSATGEALEMLLAAARAERDRVRRPVVTFSKKVFIPLTTLCRDYCGYCTFRRDPGEPGAHTMGPAEVLAVARAGARVGCKEALFSLGDRPEASFPEHREALRRLGHTTTLGYLKAMCELVLAETPLLPHANPGLMGLRDLLELGAVNASLGLMLETASDRLGEPGMPHDRAPDKRPRHRLATLEAAGRLGVPFTTGILIGIGETPAERVDALIAIRDLHERYGHIQEVIVQGFRAKPHTPMRAHPEPTLADVVRTVAVARLLFGGAMNLQSPPNLMPDGHEQLLAAGLNDWGGISPVTKDHINPEAPWPQIPRLRATTARAGLELRERLAVYPEYIADGRARLPERLAERVAGLVDEDGLVRRELEQ
jgi:FO synthase